MDRPCDLLVIMAKATLKGNYLWVNEIEIFVGISCEVLLGNKSLPLALLSLWGCVWLYGTIIDMCHKKSWTITESLFCGKVLDERWRSTCNLHMQLWRWKYHNVKWVQVLNRLQVRVINTIVHNCNGCIQVSSLIM